MTEIMVDQVPVKITNPEKLLWPDLNIRKIDYIIMLIELGPYLLPHASNRLLTTIRYPDGIDGKFFYQKNIPKNAPEWIDWHEWNNNRYIVLNTTATLIWLANQAVLEFHTTFNTHYKASSPTHLVFDLDPSEGQDFQQVIETALIIHETLNSLGIMSWVKTSGATGLQIFIPVGERYNYTIAREINEFFGKYFSQKYPSHITIERIVKKRGTKLYFDYLQMWQGKTITMVYSPRARPAATVSMPVDWEELKLGIRVEDFTLLNAKDRLQIKGDIFKDLYDNKYIQNLDFLLKHI